MKRIIAAAIVVGLGVACGVADAPREQEGAEADARALSDDATTAAPAAGDSAYRDAALAAAEWLRSTAIPSERGTAWPADPDDTAAVVTNLYTGTPGVVLFFLELAAHTGDQSYLDDARGGADFLMARMAQSGTPADAEGRAPAAASASGIASADPTMQVAGLYTGLAGVSFVLNETYRATGQTRYLDGAMRAVELIHAQARESGDGVDWVDSTDIVSGSAGTGLFLLYAAREMDHPASLRLAERAGRRLLEVAEKHDTGLGWRIHPEYPRLMPNFSHGTAGVAYFLAALHEATGDAAFRDAAVAGANRLLSLAETEGDVCLVFHHTEGGEELQYLSWCHGPAGTARTFYKLWQITADPTWMTWTLRSANGVYDSGIPETLTEGFWNNVGQCCGSAGVAEFALAMHSVGTRQISADGEPVGTDGRATDGPAEPSRHVAFAVRAADDLLARATANGGRLMWVQAEHRTQPEFLVAQTGYMQGAAGIGMMLLHLDAAITGRASHRIVFPDTPY